MPSFLFSEDPDRSRCLMCGIADVAHPEDDARFCSSECTDAWEVLVHLEAGKIRDEMEETGDDHGFFLHVYEPSLEDQERRVIRGRVVVVRNPQHATMELLPSMGIVLGPVDSKDGDG